MAGLRFKSKIGILSYLPGQHYIEVPKKTIAELGGTFKQRLTCSVNGKVKFQCGLMPLGGGDGYIMFSKARMKAVNAKAGDRLDIILTPDKSKFGLPMPPELKELLKQDKEGKKRFDKLTPGMQRYILHYVGTAKNPDLRLERAFMLITNLKKCETGKETFRKMLGKWD